MNTGTHIILATLAAGLGSVLLAALLARKMARFNPTFLLSFAAGALLATALLHLLPEAFRSGIAPQTLFAVLLAAVLGFFLLDKFELYHHAHEHHTGPAAQLQHAHAHDAYDAEHQHHHQHHHAHSHKGGALNILLGDTVHCLGDGFLIAAAFLTDVRLGWMAALAVLAHEVPHHVGDLVVLRGAHPAQSLRRAVFKLCLAGAATVLGGALGWLALSSFTHWLPYMLVLASASFIYVALADLIPQLQKHLRGRDTALQITGLALGGALIVAAMQAMHGAHDHHAEPHAKPHADHSEPASQAHTHEAH